MIQFIVGLLIGSGVTFYVMHRWTQIKLKAQAEKVYAVNKVEELKK